MKILLITDNHTPSGGAENYFFELKARLKQRGFEVYSLGFGPRQIIGKDFFIFKSVKQPFLNLFWRIFLHPLMYLKLRSTIQKINPDIIHIHNIKQYTPSLLRAIKSYPVIQTVHDFSYLCPLAQNIHTNGNPCESGMQKSCFLHHQVKYNKLIYLCLTYGFLKTREHSKRTIKKYIVPSPLLMEYLKKNKFNHVTYIPPFKMEKNDYSFTNINPYQFLFAGNIGNHKGITLLIDEFALACQKNPQLLLCIAGKGKEEKKMHQQIKRQSLMHNIKFVGWQSTLDSFYKESIAIIFPSIGLEAFGLVITESMGHARPVIAINRGTASWLIEDNQTGLLFDPHKKGNLAEKILSIAGNKTLAMNLGQKAFVKLQGMKNNEEILEEIIAVYREVCGKHTSHRYVRSC